MVLFLLLPFPWHVLANDSKQLLNYALIRQATLLQAHRKEEGAELANVVRIIVWWQEGLEGHVLKEGGVGEILIRVFGGSDRWIGIH